MEVPCICVEDSGGSREHLLHTADRFERILYCVHLAPYSLLVLSITCTMTALNGARRKGTILIMPTTLLNVDRLSKFHRKTVVKASDYDNIRFVITGLVCGIDKYQSTVLNRLLVTRTLTDVIAVTRYSDILKVVMGSLIISSLLIHRQVCRWKFWKSIHHVAKLWEKIQWHLFQDTV